MKLISLLHAVSIFLLEYMLFEFAYVITLNIVFGSTAGFLPVEE